MRFEVVSVVGRNGETLDLVTEVVGGAGKSLEMVLMALEMALRSSMKASTKACITACGHMQVGGWPRPLRTVCWRWC